MTKTKHPNHGSSLEDFLKEGWKPRSGNRHRGEAGDHMAAPAGNGKAQAHEERHGQEDGDEQGFADRVLNPEDGNVTLETLQRAARAVGKATLERKRRYLPLHWITFSTTFCQRPRCSRPSRALYCLHGCSERSICVQG